MATDVGRAGVRYDPPENHNSLISCLRTRFGLEFSQISYVRPNAPTVVHLLHYPSDSWRMNCIMFFLRPHPEIATCIPLPNMAATEGHECGQRLLPVCTGSREWKTVAADWQQSHTLKDWPILPPKGKHEREC